MSTALNKIEIGRRIEVLRLSKGLSQRELSRLTKIAQSAISDFEAGKRLPSTKTLEKLLQFFAVSPADLLSPPEENPEDSKRKFALRLISEKLDSMTSDELSFVHQLIDKVISLRIKSS